MQINPPVVGSLWLHKNGNIYKVLLNANVDSEREEYPPTVVYEDVETGIVYAKPLATFFRSRVQYTLKDINCAPWDKTFDARLKYNNQQIRRIVGNDDIYRKIGKYLIDAGGQSKEEYDDGRY